jgi:hypothetical protein
MNRPPLWMNVRVKDEEKNTKFFIPLPLFLLLPIVIVIMLVLLPFILIGVAVTWNMGWGWGRMAFHGLLRSFGLFWSMRGLKVDVRNERALVQVTVL